MRNTILGDNQASSVKVLQQREAVQMRFNNGGTDKAVKIYELVGGVESFLGTVDPKAGALIGSDVNTSIIGKVDGKTVPGKFQITQSLKEFDISSDGKGSVQITVRK